MKKIYTTMILISIITIFSGCNKKTNQQELQVYSIIHEEETIALTKLFTEKTGIPVTFLRASTGELVNRVIAEKNNPQADIVNKIIFLEVEGEIEDHTSANEEIEAAFYSKDEVTKLINTEKFSARAQICAYFFTKGMLGI